MSKIGLNPAMDHVYRQVEELRKAIRWDSFNLSMDQQGKLEMKLDELKRFIDSEYGI